MDINSLKKGDVIQHKLSKDWLLVIEVQPVTVKCRTKSFQIIEFFDYELEPK